MAEKAGEIHSDRVEDQRVQASWERGSNERQFLVISGEILSLSR